MKLPFNVDLSDTEIEILSNYLLIEYIDSEYIRTPSLLKVQLPSSDFKVFSPANFLDKLMAMLEICKQVKDHPKEAPEILPVREGFFFGSYEYDSYYFKMIDYTIGLFEHILD